MITADDARQLHDKEVKRKSDEEADRREKARIAAIEHERYVKNKVFPEKLAEIENDIRKCIKDGERKFRKYIGQDGTGAYLCQLLVEELNANGYKAYACQQEFVPEDRGCVADGDYGHDSYWKNDITVEW